jgi:general secretion pathway protein L
MSLIGVISGVFWQWIDGVAECLIALVDRVAKPRKIELVEEEPARFAIRDPDVRKPNALRAVKITLDGAAIADRVPSQVETALRGACVELDLLPERFVFKPLDLPSRAVEFLDGVVRAQIDRLTPWNSELAAFGFSNPASIGGDRVTVTVAATAKPLLAPLVQALAAKGARTVTVSTRPPGVPALPAITIIDERVAGAFNGRKARRILVIVLVSCALLTATATIAAAVINSNLEIRQAELAQRIMARRGAALTARSASGDPATAAERALARRKNQTPSAVIALEVLSRILPDRTYVTELRIESDKLRVTGITDDAPRLIRLMEQTPHFTQATFFAPITRSPSDIGDRFDIEARLEPVFSQLP